MKAFLALARRRLWPRSLKGQMLLSVALALLLAQAFSAVALYRAQIALREAALVHTAAFRLLTWNRAALVPGRDERRPRLVANGPWSMRIEEAAASPLLAGEPRMRRAEKELRQVLGEQSMPVDEVVVVERPVAADPHSLRRIARRQEVFGTHAGPPPETVLVAGVRRAGEGEWLVARVIAPRDQGLPLLTLIGQTLFIYLVLVGAIALILRRITRPLAALTDRVERFAYTRDAEGQLRPQGPDDLRRLILAHNAMEARIAALLDEKDVMLGAIGHDLKTPLAALRVRIESVEDEGERARMAATIEDIVRTLDDILSLARVGRPRDPREASELSALVASVVEEYEDMGEPVELGGTERIVLALRATWLRRALRNLVGNAVRYGGGARVSLVREAGFAAVRIEDDGPGIAEADIARMQEPFTRGEPSRNTETGGAGLGLTLARAIAEQHGGSLQLENRRGPDGRTAGLTATLRLPLT